MWGVAQQRSKQPFHWALTNVYVCVVHQAEKLQAALEKAEAELQEAKVLVWVPGLALALVLVLVLVLVGVVIGRQLGTCLGPDPSWSSPS